MRHASLAVVVFLAVVLTGSTFAVLERATHVAGSFIRDPLRMPVQTVRVECPGLEALSPPSGVIVFRIWGEDPPEVVNVRRCLRATLWGAEPSDALCRPLRSTPSSPVGCSFHEPPSHREITAAFQKTLRAELAASAAPPAQGL